MKTNRLGFLLAATILLAACSKESAQETAQVAETTPEVAPLAVANPAVEIVPGLTMRIMQVGSGAVAEIGHSASVHYTGWLYDASAENARGTQFDSSRDRGHFEFPLGGGRVIKGWDQGVVGMKIGETRELTIAPELAYGERAVGELIPPGSTLVFEVALVNLRGGNDAETE